MAAVYHDEFFLTWLYPLLSVVIGEWGYCGMGILVSPCLSSCLSVHPSVDIFVSILLNLYNIDHNHFVSPCLSVHQSHMPCPLYGLLLTFISAKDQSMHHRCLVYLWGEIKELIPNCRSFPGDGFQPCLTTLGHLGGHKRNAVCIRLMPVAILERISIHMTCASCRAHAVVKCVLEKTTVSHVHHETISPGIRLQLI